MQRLIIFLIRMKLGVRKYRTFRFDNQRSSNDSYYFTATHLLKIEGCSIREAHVSLNWLLNKECKIVKLEGGGLKV